MSFKKIKNISKYKVCGFATFVEEKMMKMCKITRKIKTVL